MGKTHKHDSSDAPLRDGLTSSSREASVMEVEPRGQPGTVIGHQLKGRNARGQRTNAISQEEVRKAWQKVRAKGGVGGVDGESIKSFERNLRNNLYKLWNRMSSGSYHPKAVLRVEIPKGDGSTRPLGIPTLLDRVAQEVVRARLEPVVEGFFHPDSYGFRPNKSAPEAAKTCRERCWKYDWVLDVDIQKFFDTIDHELMMKAVKKHCAEKWMVIYIERWLKAPVQQSDGTVSETLKGTPQGGVISPTLANLYLHYAFDNWMMKTFSGVKFERYADDIVIHCSSIEQSKEIEIALGNRLAECGLKLHPEKTKVVYCKDDNRKGMYPTKKFTFLGYSFQTRSASTRDRKRLFTNFLPAVSPEAKKEFRADIKETRLLKMTHLSIKELADALNPRISGWYNYFQHFYQSELYTQNYWLDCAILKWLRKKHKLRMKGALRYLRRLAKAQPTYFAHWRLRLPGRAV
jgi:RNA-directed DNA polymerase